MQVPLQLASLTCSCSAFPLVMSTMWMTPPLDPTQSCLESIESADGNEENCTGQLQRSLTYCPQTTLEVLSYQKNQIKHNPLFHSCTLTCNERAENWVKIANSPPPMNAITTCLVERINSRVRKLHSIFTFNVRYMFGQSTYKEVIYLL